MMATLAFSKLSWNNFFLRMYTLPLMCNGKSHQKYSMFETKFNNKIFNTVLLIQIINITNFKISRSTTLINLMFCVDISNKKHLLLISNRFIRNYYSGKLNHNQFWYSIPNFQQLHISPEMKIGFKVLLLEYGAQIWENCK